MSDLNIIRIPILPKGLVNAHLVVTAGKAILVDAGLPGTEKEVARALTKNGLGFEDIAAIVITHAHVDHAGNAAKLRELSGAPIIAHRADLPYYRREKVMTFCATGWFGRLFMKTGLMLEPYAAFEPDIIVEYEDCFDLAEFGCDGVVRHTPGHTEGSLSVELDGKAALVGDLISSGILLGGLMCTGHAKCPPFEDDTQAVSQALKGLVSRGHKQFYMGHGGPLPASEVLRHARKISSLATEKIDVTADL